MVLDSSGHGSRVQLNGLTVHLNKRGEKKKNSNGDCMRRKAIWVKAHC